MEAAAWDVGGVMVTGAAVVGATARVAFPRGAVAVAFCPLARGQAVGSENCSGGVIESRQVGSLWTRDRHSGAARAVGDHRPPRVRHSPRSRAASIRRLTLTS